MTLCVNCGSPARTLYLNAVEKLPVMEPALQEHPLALQKCRKCGSLWFDLYYEPYDSFRYLVFWPESEELWSYLLRCDRGLLRKWHSASVYACIVASEENAHKYCLNGRPYGALLPESRGIDPVDLLAAFL